MKIFILSFLKFFYNDILFFCPNKTITQRRVFNMPEIVKYSLPADMAKKDEELMGSTSLVGRTGLGMPSYVNTNRAIMNTNHTSQYVVPVHPDFPRIFTNMENTVGAHSDGYFKTDSDLKVVRKITKFENSKTGANLYYLFVYNKKAKEYQVIKREGNKNLTESFGYAIDNTKIDSYDEGDKIKKGTVLFHSTSYDKYMNYGYGKNAITMYSLDSRTSEDSAYVSESFAKSFTSYDMDVIEAVINDNDCLLNLFGERGEITEENKDYYYKPIPEIGSVVSGVVLATRQRYKKQQFYDLKRDSLNEIHDEDTTYLVDNNTEIVDIEIYNNNEERRINSFNRELYRLYDLQTKFYKEIIEFVEDLKEQNLDYSRDIDYLYRRSLEMVETKKKWKLGDNPFSNMAIRIHIRRLSPLKVGHKITGRYGNKSVISEVVPDELMPIAEDGRRVEVVLNLLAIINRTTSMPLYEINFNAYSKQIVDKMKTMKTLEEKAKLFFHYLEDFNHKQYTSFYRDYCELDKKGKEEFIQDILDDGIYLNQPPIENIADGDRPIFDRLRLIKKDFPWLTDQYVYCMQPWGETERMLSKYFIGEMYLMKLKQSDKRGFSARSTGAIDMKGLPTRSHKSKSHLERVSETPIRMGEYETLNFSICLGSEDIAMFHGLYRTSVKGRKDLVKLLMKDPDSEDYIESIDDSYDSRVAEILQVIFKSLSIGIEFVDTDKMITPMSRHVYSPHEIDHKQIICNDYQFDILKASKWIAKHYLDINGVVVREALYEYINEELKKNKIFSDGEPDDIKEILDEPLLDLII